MQFYRVPFKSLLRMKIKWAIVSFLCTNFFSFVFMGKAVAIRKQYLWFLHLDSQVKLKTNKPTHPLSLTKCTEINSEVLCKYENKKRFLPKMKVHRNKNFRLFPIISISQKFFSIFFLTLEKIGIDEKVICYHNISN